MDLGAVFSSMLGNISQPWTADAAYSLGSTLGAITRIAFFNHAVVADLTTVRSLRWFRAIALM